MKLTKPFYISTFKYCLALRDSNKTFSVLIGNGILHWLKANRDKNTIHSSGTKNKAPLLIIQGTEFNYMENIKHFQKKKNIKKSWRWDFQAPLMLQQCPLLRYQNNTELLHGHQPGYKPRIVSASN